MGAPYVLLLVLRNSDVEWCIAVEVMKQESFCKVHLRILCIFLCSDGGRLECIYECRIEYLFYTKS